MHGCPCGYYGDPVRECTCSQQTMSRYQKRISGSLLDRVDIHVEVPCIDYETLSDRRARRRSKHGRHHILPGGEPKHDDKRITASWTNIAGSRDSCRKKRIVGDCREGQAATRQNRGSALLLNSVTRFLTSATKCFPGPSVSGKGDRLPTAAEVSLCGEHLDREIALVRPELVITLGKLAANVVIGPASLGDLVGQMHDAERAGHQFVALPLPHPSGVSRWMNEPANQEKHAHALALLRELGRDRLL